MLYFMAAALAAVVVWTHLWRLGEVPNGMFVDESSIGYNAYCLMETGKDEYGKPWPLFFRGLGNYHDPVMVYCAAPLVGLFGLEKWVARLPSALFMLAAAVAFGFLAHHYCRRRWLAFAGAALFALLPWCFPVSRTVMGGYTAMLAGICVGWLFLLKALGGNSYRAAVAAAAGWAFAMYSHNCGRPMCVLLLAAFALLGTRLVWRRRRVALVFGASLGTLMLPMALAFLGHGEVLTSRFSEISVWKDHPDIMTLALRLASNYCDYFNPCFLFLAGDPNLRHNLPGHGLMPLAFAPLVLLGLFHAARRCRHGLRWRFLLAGIALYPAAAILTSDRFHATRCINGAPFWTLAAILGVCCAWSFLRRRNWGTLLLWGLAAALAMELAIYQWSYFNIYPERSREYFAAPFCEAVALAASKLTEQETLYLSRATFDPRYYTHLQFFCKYPPREYQARGIAPQRVTLYGDKTDRSGYLLERDKCWTETDGKTSLVESMDPLPSRAELLAVFPCDTESNLLLYRVPGARRR